MKGEALRDAWVRFVEADGPLRCDDVLARLRADGLVPVGEDRKGRIRNLHSAAMHETRLTRVAPGLFGLNDSRAG